MSCLRGKSRLNDLKSILERILRSTPNYQENMLKLEIYRSWEDVVGPRVAKHCWPVKVLEGGLLLIAAESSSWLQSLRYLEPQILDKFEAALKGRKVKGLRFMLKTASQRDT